LIAPKVGHLPHADGHLATAAIFKLDTPRVCTENLITWVILELKRPPELAASFSSGSGAVGIAARRGDNPAVNHRRT